MQTASADTILLPDSLALPDSTARDTTMLRETLEAISTGLGEEVSSEAHAAIILGMAFIAGLIIQYILLQLGRVVLRKQPHWLSIKPAVLPHMRRAGYLLGPAISVAAVLPLIQIGDGFRHVVNVAVYVCIVLGLASLAFASVGAADGLLVYQFGIAAPDNLRARKVQTQVVVLRRVASLIIMLLTVAAILFYFEPLRRGGTALLTSAGIAGIVIGLAAQKTLGNLIAGIQIAFTQPIRVEDMVTVEGEFGRIEEITLTYVIVNTWDQRRIMLPISYFIEQPFQNWTRSSTDLLVPVLLYLDYRAPIEAIRQELARVLPTHPEWDGVMERVQVTDASERTITVRLLVSARDSQNAFSLRHAIREDIIAFLQAEHPDALPHSRVLGEDDAKPTGALGA